MEDIVVEGDVNSQYNSLLQQYLYNENIYHEGKKLEEFYLQDEKHWNFPYELSSDLNKSNIGIDPSSKEIVLIDYGLMNRRKPRKTYEEAKHPKDRITRSTYNDLARQYGFPEKPGDPNDLVTI